MIVMGITLVCMTGCQKSENYKLTEASKDELFPIYQKGAEELQQVSELQYLQDIYKSEYKLEEWRLDGVKRPGGIIALENFYIVSDQESDCVFKVDNDGNIINSVGQTGNGESEFLEPSAIAAYNNEIYVLDQGNNRVQVLDENLAYKREIKLKDTKQEDPDYIPQKIAVNGEGVFVTGISLENPVVDWYTDQVEEIAPNFLGSIGVDGEEVFLINSMVRYYDKQNDSFGATSQAPEFLVRVKEGEIEKICELPYGFYITSFLIDENGLVCASGSGGAVYRLNEEGEYEETISYIPGLQDEESPQIAVDNAERFLIAMPNARKVYRCYKE